MFRTLTSPFLFSPANINVYRQTSPLQEQEAMCLRQDIFTGKMGCSPAKGLKFGAFNNKWFKKSEKVLKTMMGMSPSQMTDTLFDGCRQNDLDKMRKAIKNHADVNDRRNNLRTALHVLVLSPNLTLPMVKLLVEKGDSDLGAKDRDNHTPLSLYCTRQEVQPEIFDYLVSRLTPEQATENLFAACRHNQLDLIKAAIGRNADVKSNQGFGVHLKTALHLLAESPNPTRPMFEALLNQGADSAALDSLKKTPFYDYCNNPNIDEDVFQYLASNVKPSDINKTFSVSPYKDGETVAHVLAKHKRVTLSMLKVLGNAGADFNAQDYRSQTPVVYACSNPAVQKSWLEYFKERNAAFNTTGIDYNYPSYSRYNHVGYGPLHALLENPGDGTLAMVEYVLKQGAQTNPITRVESGIRQKISPQDLVNKNFPNEAIKSQLVELIDKSQKLPRQMLSAIQNRDVSGYYKLLKEMSNYKPQMRKMDYVDYLLGDENRYKQIWEYCPSDPKQFVLDILAYEIYNDLTQTFPLITGQDLNYSDKRLTTTRAMEMANRKFDEWKNAKDNNNKFKHPWLRKAHFRVY